MNQDILIPNAVLCIDISDVEIFQPFAWKLKVGTFFSQLTRSEFQVLCVAISKDNSCIYEVGSNTPECDAVYCIFISFLLLNPVCPIMFEENQNSRKTNKSNDI